VFVPPATRRLSVRATRPHNVVGALASGRLSRGRPARARPITQLKAEFSNYIELHAYQDALVRKGMEEMKKGSVVSHEDVVKRLKRTRRAS